MADRVRSSGLDRYDGAGGARADTGRWASRDQGLLDNSLQRQLREREKREREKREKGTSWRTIVTVTLVFLMVGPFRQLLIKMVQQVLAGDGETTIAPGDDGFEF